MAPRTLAAGCKAWRCAPPPWNIRRYHRIAFAAVSRVSRDVSRDPSLPNSTPTRLSALVSIPPEPDNSCRQFIELIDFVVYINVALSSCVCCSDDLAQSRLVVVPAAAGVAEEARITDAANAALFAPCYPCARASRCVQGTLLLRPFCLEFFFSFYPVSSQKFD